MVHGLTGRSGGKVRIYSEVGHGTMVCIYLPRYFGKEAEEPVEGQGVDPPAVVGAWFWCWTTMNRWLFQDKPFFPFILPWLTAMSLCGGGSHRLHLPIEGGYSGHCIRRKSLFRVKARDGMLTRPRWLAQFFGAVIALNNRGYHDWEHIHRE